MGLKIKDRGTSGNWCRFPPISFGTAQTLHFCIHIVNKIILHKPLIQVVNQNTCLIILFLLSSSIWCYTFTLMFIQQKDVEAKIFYFFFEAWSSRNLDLCSWIGKFINCCPAWMKRFCSSMMHCWMSTHAILIKENYILDRLVVSTGTSAENIKAANRNR